MMESPEVGKKLQLIFNNWKKTLYEMVQKIGRKCPEKLLSSLWTFQIVCSCIHIPTSDECIAPEVLIHLDCIVPKVIVAVVMVIGIFGICVCVTCDIKQNSQKSE